MTLLLLTTGSINISTQTAKSKITNTVADKKTTIVFVHELWADGSSC